MASSFWKGVVGVGLFALAHAACSAAQHRSYMRLTEKENETLPIDVSCKQIPGIYHIGSHAFVFLKTASLVLCFQIVLQTLLSFVITCYGIVHISGEFKDMDASSELKNKTFDTLRNHPSFYLFNHRGRVLFSAPEQEPSTPSPHGLPSNPLRLRKLENFH
ncbi:ER membrane protein complex subunit 5 isoform X1 [Pimephales promelas]|uniref:ER membrane protein complex subunit 5 isoform X1 n=1 Tax=Pimephales promelas TaxID=90988 RepID=UPI001955B2E7|nr:ER membrane protein complex subunit 5 isoform X1 [Pimephales promelas]